MQKFRVIVADDVPEVRLIVVEMLKRNGHSCIEAADGKDVLELIENSPVDFILSDIEMPNMNGFELAQQIKSSKNKQINSIPVIAVTAYYSYSLDQRCKRAGFDAVLAKPHSEIRLFELMERLHKKRKL